MSVRPPQRDHCYSRFINFETYRPILSIFYLKDRGLGGPMSMWLASARRLFSPASMRFELLQWATRWQWLANVM